MYPLQCRRHSVTAGQWCDKGVHSASKECTPSLSPWRFTSPTTFVVAPLSRTTRSGTLEYPCRAALLKIQQTSEIGRTVLSNNKRPNSLCLGCQSFRGRWLLHITIYIDKKARIAFWSRKYRATCPNSTTISTSMNREHSVYIIPSVWQNFASSDLQQPQPIIEHLEVSRIHGVLISPANARSAI